MQRDLFNSYFGDVANHEEAQAWAREVAEFFQSAFGVDVTDVTEGRPLPTFEEVLGLIDLAANRNEALYGMPLDADDEPDLTLRSLRRRLVLVLADAIRRRVPQAPEVHYKLVENLRDGGRLQHTSFLSTNYDTLIDVALEDRAIPPVDRRPGRVVDYGFSDLLPRSLFPDRETRSFPIYKVHGSLNWLYCPVCTDLVVTSGPDIITRLVRDPATARCTRCETMREPVIVPPTYYKDISNVYLAIVWNRAARELRECGHLVVCGYSLPDADMHIRYLIKAAQLNRSFATEKLQITLVNSYYGKTAIQRAEELQRYARFFGYDVVMDPDLSFEGFAADPGILLGRARE
jgi:hypothetical protein